jgi:hypothetical protein
MRAVAEQYPDDLDAGTLYADALFLLEPRRGRRDINAPNIQRLHAASSSACWRSTSASRRVPPLRPRDRVHGAAREGRGLCRASRRLDPRREPHQPHAVAHVQSCRPVGRLRARQHPGVALGPEGGDRRRLRHLSRSQPAHAAVRGVDGRPGRGGHPGGQGLREAHGDTMYHVLTLVRFGRFDEIPASQRGPSARSRRRCGTSRRATRSCAKGTCRSRAPTCHG